MTDDTKLPALSAAELATSIEHVRVELMQIEAMLRCLYEVLLYADDDDSVMHADVAKVCARLLNESVGRLEIVVRRCERNLTDELSPSSGSESGGPENNRQRPTP